MPAALAQKNRKKEERFKKFSVKLQGFIENEKVREKIESKILKDLRELFEANGALNLHQLP